MNCPACDDAGWCLSDDFETWYPCSSCKKGDDIKNLRDQTPPPNL